MTGPDESRTPASSEGGSVPEETFPADRTFDSALLGDGLWTGHGDDPGAVPAEDERPGEGGGLVLEDRRAKVRDTILDAARGAGLKAVFAEGRRSSDVTLVLLKGQRLEVLAFAPRLVEAYPLDLEVMRSAEVNGVYELMLAVTDVLEDQGLKQPERRRKLQRFLCELED
jgi:hypothetical protein